jgi:hypothetical protein
MADGGRGPARRGLLGAGRTAGAGRRREVRWEHASTSSPCPLPAEALNVRAQKSDAFVGGSNNATKACDGPRPPLRRIRVYTKAGSTLAAALVRDHSAIIDTSLYWAAVKSRDEGAYLLAVLNSALLNELVRPFQAVGAFGARHFDKYVWRAPIPTFDADDPLHRRLVTLAGEGEAVAASVELPANGGFQSARRRIREALTEAGIAHRLDEVVAELLSR